jgi:hypothetical protein
VPKWKPRGEKSGLEVLFPGAWALGRQAHAPRFVGTIEAPERPPHDGICFEPWIDSATCGVDLIHPSTQQPSRRSMVAAPPGQTPAPVEIHRWGANREPNPRIRRSRSASD